MKYKKNFEKCTPFATSALLTTRVRPCVEEGRTLDFKQEYFQFGKKFGRCTKNILASGSRTSNAVQRAALSMQVLYHLIMHIAKK